MNDKFNKSDLVEIQRVAQSLNSSLLPDLLPYRSKTTELGFRRRPESAGSGEVSIATTCTCLMAIIQANKVNELNKQLDSGVNIEQTFQLLMGRPWTSSGLPAMNPFTTALVLRALGFAIEYGQISKEAPIHLVHTEEGVAEISMERLAVTMAEGSPSTFQIEKYPAQSTVLFWFIDGIERAKINLSKKAWKSLAAWADAEFSSKYEHVELDNEPMKDPVAMAMAACACKKLHGLFLNEELGATYSLSRELPAPKKLFKSLKLLFKHQTPSGLWPKYFPIFNYQDETASNYCFAYELLEAILNEFCSDESSVLLNEKTLHGISLAANWCVKNRYNYPCGDGFYSGWNSGGVITSLEQEIPESWATAVVHMFFTALDDKIAGILNDQTLANYSDVEVICSDENWDKLIDSPVFFPGGEHTSLMQVLQAEFINPIIASNDLVRNRIEGRRSAFLFGPPGTSKTSTVKALAQKIGWPMVELNPGNFLDRGPERVFDRATEIFDDLNLLQSAVIFFDEMDAFASDRIEGLDFLRSSLTTAMLPLLQKLYNGGKVLFFMATNHQERFDGAIKRPGRFDLLLCVSPPLWKQKINRIDAFFPEFKETELKKVRNTLEQWEVDSETENILNAMTFGEFSSFIKESIGPQIKSGDIEDLDTRSFKKDVHLKVPTLILNPHDWDKQDSSYYKYKQDMQASRRQ